MWETSHVSKVQKLSVWKQAVKMLGSLLPVTIGEVAEGAPQPQALALASP